jgi:uncharacterized cupin superfamily protein
MANDGLIHWDEAKGRDVAAGPMAGRWDDLGRSAGSVTTGLRRVRVAAGMRSTPVHVHDDEEELYFVLGGAGTLWQDGATCEVRAGDVIAEVAGRAAHTFIAGAAGLEILMYGERKQSPTCRLPRTGVAWLGELWIAGAGEQHPWALEVAAGDLQAPPPGERFDNVAAVAAVAAVACERGDTRRHVRDLGAAVGSRATGVRHVVVEPGAIGCPPHAHSAEEEIFVVLDGEGVVELYECTEASPAPRALPVHAGHVLVRPAGTAVAHALRAGAAGLTYLAFGERRPQDVTYYPRSKKLSFRGLGVMGRLQPASDYWEDEPPAQ